MCVIVELRMNLLNIVKYPHEVLAKEAEPVAVVDDEVRRLVDDMVKTMGDNDGVGLAGPQVGESKRLFVAAPKGLKGPVHVFINPTIVNSAGAELGPEGCLSIPGVFGDIERARSLTVTFLNPQGEKETLEAEGFLARIIQHEYDHLNGKVFIDHLGFSERQSVLEEYKRLQHISM